MEISLENSEIITTTGEYPFYADGTYVRADELKENMLLMTGNYDRIRIAKIEEKELCDSIEVYNIEVSGNHNYFVGKNRILVHNKTLYSSDIRDTEIVSKDLLEKVKLKRDVVIAKKGSDDYRFMEMTRADGSARRSQKYKCFT